MKYILWNMKVGCWNIGEKIKALVTSGSIAPKRSTIRWKL